MQQPSCFSYVTEYKLNFSLFYGPSFSLYIEIHLRYTVVAQGYRIQGDCTIDHGLKIMLFPFFSVIATLPALLITPLWWGIGSVCREEFFTMTCKNSLAELQKFTVSPPGCTPVTPEILLPVLKLL